MATRIYPKRQDAALTVVEWYDIQDDDDWNDDGAGDTFYAAHCVSTGWLIYEDKWVVIIARTYSEDEETWHEKRAIPKGCIIDSRSANLLPMRDEGSQRPRKAHVPKVPRSNR